MKFTKLIFLLGTIGIFLTFSMQLKAQYILKEADTQYELFNYVKAIDLYEQAWKKKQALHTAEHLAAAYQLTQNYKEAESWYAIAVNMPGSLLKNRLSYAIALQSNGKYGEAKEQYKKYGELNTAVTEIQKNIWSASCDSALLWMKSPKPVVINNQQYLNSKQSDWGAVDYQDGLVFSSDRPDGKTDQVKNQKPFLKFDAAKRPDLKVYGWTGNNYLNLFEQKKTGEPVALFPLLVETGYHVAAASFSADEKEVYFTLTRIPKNPDYKEGISTINVEIYSSKKDDQANWSKPVPFMYNKVSEYSVGDPFLTKDGNTLYFVSDKLGGKGGMDIYYCKRTNGGVWGEPINAKEINTGGNERSPAIDQEGNFYFSSDGRIGMGGLDIYTAKISDNKFLGIQNLGYPVNSPQDDFFYRINKINTVFFASNRAQGTGNDDIYSFVKQKPLALKVEGIIYKTGTTEPLTGAVLNLNKIGGGNLKMQTGADGKFKFNLEGESTYNLTVDKTDFQSINTTVATAGLTGDEVIKKDFHIQVITINKAIKLDNIYYAYNKADIRIDAAMELNKLVKILRDNPTIWIELGSHTDGYGSAAYNQLLSQRRANSAIQYIVNSGIDKNRLTARGYGATQLLNHCAKGIKCSEAERQLNRRTEFKIVKY